VVACVGKVDGSIRVHGDAQRREESGRGARRVCASEAARGSGQGGNDPGGRDFADRVIDATGEV
jgi:hypothetical protein